MSKQRELRFRTSHYNLDGFRAFTYWSVDVNTFLKEEGRGRFKNTIINNVEQYSGIDDVHGEPIYEGDIIEYVLFNEKTYKQICPDLTSFHFWQETQDNETVKVVGNIHETPDLIKSKNPLA